MYSNLERYVADRKPLLGAVLNPYLSINQGLVFFPPFNEGSGPTVFDLSGNGNTGTNVNNPTWQAGKFGPQLSYGGTNESTDIGSVPGASTGNSPRTIYIIAKPNAFALATNAALFNYSNGTGGGLDAFMLFLEDNAISVGFDGHRIISPSDLSTGTTYHIAVVYPNGGTNTGETLIYIDGVEQSTSTNGGSDGAIATSVIDFHIASNAAGAGNGNVDVDMAAVWNRALSASEIALLYLEPFCGFRWTSIEQLAAYIAEAPPEIKALFMDLSTQLWTIKHSTGIFTKL